MSQHSHINVAVISLTATSDKKANVEKAFGYLEAASKAGADWIVLPEMFAFHGPYPDLWDVAEFADGELNCRLAQFAQNHRVILFAGTVAERPENSTSGKVYNTQYVFSREGAVIAKYRKAHLFNLKDSLGAPLYCESDGYLSGDRFVRVEIDGWSVALATCYDLRFPQMFSTLAAHKPVDCFVIPSAFTQQTGMYHWELLLRARAVEHLCYVIAPNQVGCHSPGKVSFGHSMVVDPWGTKVCDTGNCESLSLASIRLDRINQCRSQLPVIDNRRPEIYT